MGIGEICKRIISFSFFSLLFLNLYNLCCHYCDLLNFYVSHWKIKEQTVASLSLSSLCVSWYHLIYNLSSCSQWVDMLEVGVSQLSGNPNAEGLIFIFQWRNYEVILTHWNNKSVILKIGTVIFYALLFRTFQNNNI